MAKARILIVDDNDKAARTLAMMCEVSNADVSFVTQGGLAAEKARAFKPDLILLDIGMPDMDGYEVCRQIKADSELRRIKVVANSGWSDDAHRKRSEEAGFDDYLVKPIRIQSLEELIRSLGK
ncbi:MAG: response regulator [Alphaproteobacteria bacterium]|nr:response regulator [Alphaproteobacteria bacterium]